MHPYLYRAMFPLRITRWWTQTVMGSPFLCYDACAQYLTAPCTPALLRAACGPDVRIFVCLREPVSQNVSWWRFEQAAVAWGDSMGLSTDSVPAFRRNYPPASLAAAHALSRGEAVTNLYNDAEALVGTEPASAPGTQLSVLPNWAVTWPNGHLSVAARNGMYHRNLKRWFKWFARDRFEFIEVQELSEALPDVLARVKAHLPKLYTGAFPRARSRQATALNRSQPLRPELEPTRRDTQEMRDFYHEHNQALFELIERRYKW